MRVVGGAWRGRSLRAPGGRATRPTSDRVREAVFDVLEDLIRRARTTQAGRPAGPELGQPAVAESGQPAVAEPGQPAVAEAGEREAAVSGPLAGPAAGPLAGHRVLDLFAGSGALGIEALSRGAAHCTFVERDRPALHALRANLAAVGVEVLRRRAETAPPPPPDGATGAPAEPALPPGMPAGVASPARRPLRLAGPTARIAAVDARRALVADARGGEMYTLVLVDPPYARYGELEGDLARLLAPLLAPGALVVLETHRDQALRSPWRTERVKRYGDTQVAFMTADEE